MDKKQSNSESICINANTKTTDKAFETPYENNCSATEFLVNKIDNIIPFIIYLNVLLMAAYNYKTFTISIHHLFISGHT